MKATADSDQPVKDESKSNVYLLFGVRLNILVNSEPLGVVSGTTVAFFLRYLNYLLSLHPNTIPFCTSTPFTYSCYFFEIGLTSSLISSSNADLSVKSVSSRVYFTGFKKITASFDPIESQRSVS